MPSTTFSPMGRATDRAKQLLCENAPREFVWKYREYSLLFLRVVRVNSPPGGRSGASSNSPTLSVQVHSLTFFPMLS
jgi:hypothetical protein